MNYQKEYQILDRLLNKFFREKWDMDYRLKLDEKMSKSLSEPFFRLYVIADPEKYHFAGENFNREYMDILDELDNYVEQIVKLLGLKDNVMTKWEFDKDALHEFYVRVLTKLKKKWKYFQWKMSANSKFPVPKIKKIEATPYFPNGDYDVKIYLDEHKWEPGFLFNKMNSYYDTVEGLRLDSIYITFEK